VNKFDMLAGLRQYMQERWLTNSERAAIVLCKDSLTNAWDGPWDDDPLLIKLGGWSDAEISQRRPSTTTTSPDQYTAYSEILFSENLDEVVYRRSKAASKQFGVGGALLHKRPGRIYFMNTA
jgi:hypothetical protein